MPWAAVAGAVAGAVANKALAPKPSAGGGGGGGSTYVPQQLEATDANFLYNKGRYESGLNDQYNATNATNNQLLQGQLNNPYNAVQQQTATWAQDALLKNSQGAQAASINGWDNSNAQNQFNKQQQQAFQDNFGNVKDASKTLYGMGTDSNAQYKALMDYQNSQLPAIQQSQGNLYAGGNQVLQTSQDPQKELYNRTLANITDQSRASQYARGIQSSPYGAALENVANQNFNIDWQNQQLARQAQGLQAAQGAYGSSQAMGNQYTAAQSGLQSAKNENYANTTNAASQQYANYLNAMNQSNAMNNQTLAGINQNASNMGQIGASQVMAAGQAQNNAYQNIYNQQNQALQNYAGNNSQYLQGLNQLQSNDLGYMNNGQGAQNQAFQQNAYNQNQRQQGIGAVSGVLGNAVKNTDWSKVGNSVSGWFGGGGTDAGSGNDAAMMNWANNSGY